MHMLQGSTADLPDCASAALGQVSWQQDRRVRDEFSTEGALAEIRGPFRAHDLRTIRSADALPLGEWVEVLRANLSERWARYQQFRATCEELAGCSDRDLADLGMHRSNIREIAREHVYRR